MVLTQEELITSLQNEVRILVHLAGKVHQSKLDYRPTPKQRSTLELLQYMSMMGPSLVAVIKTGNFQAIWKPAQEAAKKLSYEQTVAAIQKQSDEYAHLLSDWTEGEFRAEVEMFGRKSSRGSILVNMVLGGHAAYRTQLFCYLKACGRDELSTMDLWAGRDAPAPA
jgi:hypothetical protein